MLFTQRKQNVINSTVNLRAAADIGDAIWVLLGVMKTDGTSFCDVGDLFVTDATVLLEELNQHRAERWGVLAERGGCR